MLYSYTEDEYIFNTTWEHSQVRESSRFDAALQTKWQKAADEGALRYRLNILSSTVLPGRFAFLAQLNPDRALNRRAPDNIKSLSQPFDHEKFNFTKVKDVEILFQVKKEGAPENIDDDQVKDFIIINVSPLEFGHSLLVPALKSCLPQVLTVHSLELGIEVLLLSASPAFRVGFNSLCGFATVNHLHLHLYYLQHSMLLERIDVNHLSGPCYELINYPAQGFVFQLSPGCNPAALARAVYKLTSYLQNENIAHNVYMTRGKLFNFQHVKSDVLDTVRVYVWARRHSAGVKNREAYDPALCELFGHLVIKMLIATRWSRKK
ncbi:GDP-D-glucose phosphorylase 1 isoform X2 [Anabrus simplex]|uniref:GDP-D-glucose phosphorylase 1 isoform X2 n=1 Tax=Anabrus simplex TaxID=316456 RepID=UPI0035A275D4